MVMAMEATVQMIPINPPHQITLNNPYSVNKPPMIMTMKEIPLDGLTRYIEKSTSSTDFYGRIRKNFVCKSILPHAISHVN
jgi:hypothetical protein